MHPLTELALRELAPDAERADLRGGTAKYADLLEKLWRVAEDVLIVEHDIQLTPDALREAVECPCVWSTSQYQGESGLITHALGCTRFRAELMRTVPDAAARARKDASFGRGQYLDHWSHIDSKLAAVLRDKGSMPSIAVGAVAEAAMGKRIDAEDTVDVATHFLHRWQAEGFGLGDIECHVEYASVKPGGRRLPIEATVTIKLVPSQ